MNKKILFLILAVLMVFPAFAQKQNNGDHEQKRKELMEFKLKFLADEMGLNDEQRKTFNDVYMQMENERRKIFKKLKEAEKSVANKKDASEAEYEKASKEISEARDQMVELDKKYEDKFSTFLTKKQIFKMKEAEEAFKEKMRKCRDKRKNSNK